MAEGFLQSLIGKAGFYQGHGINHEAEPFLGSLVIRPAFGGVLLWFRAVGSAGQVFHEEVVLIGNALSGGLTMTSLNTNIPAAQHFASEAAAADRGSFVTPDFGNLGGFRERVTLTIADAAITYAFAWGMPGQPVEARSEATMAAAAGFPPDCPIAGGHG